MIKELLSEWTLVQNWIFIIFLFCFLINVRVLGSRRKLVSTMFYSLFRKNERDSIFAEPIDNEFASKILLSIQTILLSSLIIYCILIHDTVMDFNTANNLLYIFAGTCLIILFFILIKFLLNTIFGNIFFSGDKVRLWNDTLFSILAVSGLILFIPTLFMFYIEGVYKICYYFVLFYLVILVILTIYKIYEIFFLRKGLFLYFILYLCTLEIMPLFLVYKACFYLFTSMQKGTLWLQM